MSIYFYVFACMYCVCVSVCASERFDASFDVLPKCDTLTEVHVPPQGEQHQHESDLPHYTELTVLVSFLNLFDSFRLSDREELIYLCCKERDKAAVITCQNKAKQLKSN